MLFLISCFAKIHREDTEFLRENKKKDTNFTDFTDDSDDCGVIITPRFSESFIAIL